MGASCSVDSAFHNQQACEHDWEFSGMTLEDVERGCGEKKGFAWLCRLPQPVERRPPRLPFVSDFLNLAVVRPLTITTPKPDMSLNKPNHAAGAQAVAGTAAQDFGMQASGTPCLLGR